MKKSYIDQAKRVVRSFAKLPKDNYPESMTEEEWDDYYHFFQDAYHLKDWIIHDEVVTIGRDEVNNFIDGNINMKLLQSVVNSLKHLKITNPKNQFPNINFEWTEKESKGHPSVVYEDQVFLLAEDGDHILLEDGDKMMIESEQKNMHPKKLAVKVLIAWNNFFKQHGLEGGFRITDTWDKHL